MEQLLIAGWIQVTFCLEMWQSGNPKGDDASSV